MAKTKSTIDQMAELIDKTVREADEVLRQIVQRDGKPTATEIAYFRGLGWDVSMLPGNLDRSRKSLLRELARMTRVCDKQAIAGTESKRNDLEGEYEQALDELETKGPALQESIAKATAELQRLTSKPKTLARRLEECKAAVLSLREELPLEIRESAQAKMDELTASEVYRKVRSMKSRAEMIENILKIPASSEQAKLHAQAVRKDLLEKIEGSWTVNPTSWGTYLGELRQELATIQEQLPDIEAEVNDRLLSAQAEFDFYAK